MNHTMTKTKHARTLLLLAAIAVAGCDSKAQGRELPSAEESGKLTLKSTAPEEIERVVAGPGKRGQAYVGTLKAKSRAEIGPNVSGVVLKMLVDEGDEVKRGQLLFAIESTHASLAVSQAKATVTAAQVQLAQAEREQARIKKLVDRGSTSSANLDNADSAVEAAAASLKLAKVGLRAASARLADHKVKSPIDGVVTRRFSSVGELVNQQPPTVAMVIQDLDVLELRIDVPEAAVRVAPPGTEFKAHVPALGTDHVVKVTRIVEEVDPQTRTVELVARIENPDRKLLPGMYVEVAAGPHRPGSNAPGASKPGPAADGESQRGAEE